MQTFTGRHLVAGIMLTLFCSLALAAMGNTAEAAGESAQMRSRESSLIGHVGVHRIIVKQTNIVRPLAALPAWSPHAVRESVPGVR